MEEKDAAIASIGWRSALREPWCCGSLESGSVSVAVANLCTILVLFLWVIQILMEIEHFFIAIIVTSMVTFVLFVVNVCLICGARSRKRALVAPWLCVYAAALPCTVVASALEFHHLGQLKPISVCACVILIYFYVVIAAFYHELKVKDNLQKVGTEKKENCLIALEDCFSQGCDDTFTDLANARKSVEKEDLLFPNKNPFLPQPDEVIQVDAYLAKEDEVDFFKSVDGKRDPFCKDDPDLFTESSSDLLLTAKLADVTFGGGGSGMSKSIDTNLQKRSLSPAKTEIDGGDQTEVVQQKKRQIRNISQSHSGLVGIIDSSFTPFKQKQGNSEQMPKMKIFLPRSSSSSSSEESSDDSSEGDEETKNREKLLSDTKDEF